MADEVVVMYLGRVVEKGPVDDIFHNPKHPYTRALLALDPERPARAADEAADDQRLDPAPVQPAAGLPVPPALPGVHARDVRHARAELMPRWRAAGRRAASCTAARRQVRR